MADMNGANAPPQHQQQPATNGFHNDQNPHDAQPTPDVNVILQAVEAVYNPRSTNEVRAAANELLETTKSSPQARELGFTLAYDSNKDPTLRHYGLTLLDYHTRYVWDGYDEDVEQLLRECIVKLAQGVRKEDPAYLRNKVAHVWTIFAKRSWATYWMDMDEQLVRLFEASEPHREVVLYVLQALAEDVFSRDDTLAATRGEVLAAACIEIFTPEALMADKNVSRTGQSIGVRYGNEGWLQRLTTFLEWSLNNDHTATVKTLETLGSALSWMPSATIAATTGIAPVCRAVVTGDAAIRLAAVESLTTVCSRDKMPDDDASKIIMPLFSQDSVASLHATYQWARVHDPTDIDDAKYTLLQKTSKLLSRLGAWIEKNPALLPESSDLPSFFELLFEVARDLSLKVSEPVLRLWTHLLRIPTLRDSAIIQQSIGPLMEMCSQRLVRYEALPEDTSDPIVLFINEDFDTLPEKHLFLGNYRRYCLDVVEAAVRKFPVDAVSHILGQAESLYRDIQASMQEFQPRNFSKKSPQFLRVDAQVMLVDASVKGYTKWLGTQPENDPQQNEQDRNAMLGTFVSYFETALPMHFKDPAVQRRILSSLTHMAMRLFQKARPDLGTQLLDRFFTLTVEDDPGQPEYSEAAKALSFLAVTESQKLAAVWADTWVTIYDELERRVQQKVAAERLDAAHELGYQNFLFAIVLHSQTLDAAAKLSKLRDMVAASNAAWQTPEFDAAVKDFGSFFGLLGLAGLPEYLYTHNFHKLDSWAEHMLDEAGRDLQNNVHDKIDHIPHRATRMLLMATFDKLRDTDPNVELAQTLWAEAIPSILPNLMQSLRHAHLFGDGASWPQLPDEMAHIIQKMLTDRFWQAGISNESMDDFYARVNASKHSYEGFASSIRGSIRQIREKSYSILCYLTRLESRFYGLPELPDVLAASVYGTAGSLSAHQWSVLLNMSDQVVRGCPVELREHFLPKVLTALFGNLEEKLKGEWDVALRRASERADGEDLGDEMKRESILRMLTYHSVLLANGLLDIDPSASQSDPGQEARMYRTILASPQLLGQILMFLTAALRMHDQRSTNVVILTLNRLLPFYRKPSEVRDYICDAVLKNAIQSFNEGYFTESQTKLAGLIAQIISLDEGSAKAVILSLPNMKPDKVERRFERLRNTKSPSQGAAVVLELLQGLRGVSIHELGKITQVDPRRKSRDKARMEMEMEMGGIVDDGIRRGGEEELEGVAGMFG